MRKILVFFLLFAKISNATTWQTVSSGFWNNASIWSTSIVPPSTSSDTFNIQYPVAIQNNLTFNSGAMLTIASAGGICGHYKMTLSSGAKLMKYGILELDSLYIPGGIVTCLAPGSVILTMNGILTLGGSLSVSGCSFAVGPWFNCQQPEYSFANGVEEINTLENISFFPNPFTANATISYELIESSKVDITVCDVLGKEISLYNNPNQTSGKHELQINSGNLQLAKGMYFVKMKTDNSQKIIKVIIK
jgi:hypothetical protein